MKPTQIIGAKETNAQSSIMETKLMPTFLFVLSQIFSCVNGIVSLKKLSSTRCSTKLWISPRQRARAIIQVEVSSLSLNKLDWNSGCYSQEATGSAIVTYPAHVFKSPKKWVSWISRVLLARTRKNRCVERRQNVSKWLQLLKFRKRRMLRKCCRLKAFWRIRQKMTRLYSMWR